MQSTRQAVTGKLSLADAGAFVQSRWTDALIANEQAESCCRDLANYTVQLFETDPAHPGPDMVVFECGDCGRKHTRVICTQ